ncbi:hypothetical protein N7541_011168 [Penicillium brevicompactum]|uniref:J domain-containing protein n=1 Tax=Penicillium brevicompactum TaxID=5074 RepID=A0A9W9QSX5_PENBR|nr:hypothetical protein N7541_011168 [Penicillium brevicompactum]
MPRVPAIRLAHAPHAHTPNRVVIVTAPSAHDYNPNHALHSPSPNAPSQAPDQLSPASKTSTKSLTSPPAPQQPKSKSTDPSPQIHKPQSNSPRQFYALSMRHHPDRNRSDPEAGQRFARISAAYNVLGNASKRAVYDRDHGFHQVHASASPGHTHTHPMGSHSSYAGSRPASGLSKRRSAFHGPPPSFYEQGGYGATGRQGDGFAAGKSGPSKFAGSGAGSRTADPEDWEGFIRRNPLHHFNARGHFRTQAAEDKRRRERASRNMRAGVADAEWPEPNPGDVSGVSFTRFWFSLGCLMLAGASAGLWPSSSPDDGRRTKN